MVAEVKTHPGRDVVFRSAEVVGEQYQRPPGTMERLQMSPKPQELSECSASEQVHITLGDTYESNPSILISFASAKTLSGVHFGDTPDSLAMFYRAEATTISTVKYFDQHLYAPNLGKPDATPEELAKELDTTSFGNSWQLFFPQGIMAVVLGMQANWTGVNNGQIVDPSTYNSTSALSSLPAQQDYSNPKNVYTSPFLYSVQIDGLLKGTRYYYRVDGSCNVYSFKIPANVYPMTVGLVADLGITDISNASVNALISFDPDVVLFTGDLCYADGYGEVWDTFGNMMEPLAANVPILMTGGDHELFDAENWLPFFTRWPMPHKASGSTNMCYYGKIVGKMHVLTLCSYAGFEAGSIQHNWAASYLRKVDRSVTPWLVVILHAPWYNSNLLHYMESELMRIAFEPLLYEYSVNLVVAGHVHAYERSVPSYNFKPDTCGMVYITIGDGGNYAGAYVPW